MSGDEAMVGSGAVHPRPGLARGWTQGPAAEDASVLARTDVRAGGHRAGYPIHMLVVGDDSRSIAAPVTRDLAHAFPGLCLDRIDGIEDLASYEASLKPGDHVLIFSLSMPYRCLSFGDCGGADSGHMSSSLLASLL